MAELVPRLGQVRCSATSPPTGFGRRQVRAGPAPYWTDWTYDNATAVRTSQTVHAVGGDTTTSYASPAAGAARPHSLTSRTTGSATTNYDYDNAGNLITQSGAAGAASYTWDDELHLAASTGAGGATSKLYDADGALLVSRDATGSTLYADDTTDVRYTTTGGVLHVTHHYTFAGRPVATQTDAGALTFVVTDPHNTGTMSLSDTTNTVTASRRFDPFGGPRGTGVGLWPDSRGFLNAPSDTSTGLTHLGARDYDPVTGRFISVDPELDLTAPSQWSAYGYANGNPTTLTDPTGRRPEGSGDYGCSNCMMTSSGSWKFGNETAGSKSVHGGTYHQSYAAAQEERTTKAHKRQEAHNSVTGDNVLAREQQQAALARARRASTVRALAAQAHASSGGGGHWYDPRDWDANTWTQVGLGAATAVLTVVNAVQLGADPLTDGLEVAVITEMAGDGAVEIAAETTTEVASESAVEVGAESEGSSVADAAESCMNSFTADTPVLMADGSQKPIATVRVGDRVMATDPETGVTRSEPVTALIRHSGRHGMVDVTLSNGSVLHSTDGHPIWDATTGTFTTASQLRLGDRLLSYRDGTRTVTKLVVHEQDLTAYNLQISTIHTYYAGAKPVLVHNSCSPNPFRGTNMSDEDSLQFHYARHGAGRSIEQYTADAKAFAENPTGKASNVTLRDGTMGTKFRTPGSPGGILDGNNNLITFWYQ